MMSRNLLLALLTCAFILSIFPSINASTVQQDLDSMTDLINLDEFDTKYDSLMDLRVLPRSDNTLALLVSNFPPKFTSTNSSVVQLTALLTSAQVNSCDVVTYTYQNMMEKPMSMQKLNVPLISTQSVVNMTTSITFPSAQISNFYYEIAILCNYRSNTNDPIKAQALLTLVNDPSTRVVSNVNFISPPVDHFASSFVVNRLSNPSSSLIQSPCRHTTTSPVLRSLRQPSSLKYYNIAFQFIDIKTAINGSLLITIGELLNSNSWVVTSPDHQCKATVKTNTSTWITPLVLEFDTYHQPHGAKNLVFSAFTAPIGAEVGIACGHVYLDWDADRPQYWTATINIGDKTYENYDYRQNNGK